MTTAGDARPANFFTINAASVQRSRPGNGWGGDWQRPVDRGMLIWPDAPSNARPSGALVLERRAGNRAPLA